MLRGFDKKHLLTTKLKMIKYINSVYYNETLIKIV